MDSVNKVIKMYLMNKVNAVVDWVKRYDLKSLVSQKIRFAHDTE